MFDPLVQLVICHGTETAFHVFHSDLLDPELRKKVSFPILEISVLFKIEQRKSNRWIIIAIFRQMINLLGWFLAPYSCYPNVRKARDSARHLP